MGYTLCVLGVRVHGTPQSIADQPHLIYRMRDHGNRNNIRRAR